MIFGEFGVVLYVSNAVYKSVPVLRELICKRNEGLRLKAFQSYLSIIEVWICLRLISYGKRSGQETKVNGQKHFIDTFRPSGFEMHWPYAYSCAQVPPKWSYLISLPIVSIVPEHCFGSVWRRSRFSNEIHRQRHLSDAKLSEQPTKRNS